MAWFRLFACGEDFPVIIDNNVEVVGFYTTRYIEAPSTAKPAQSLQEFTIRIMRCSKRPGSAFRGISLAIAGARAEATAGAISN